MIVIGSDHGGFRLKEALKKYLEGKGLEIKDVGCYDESSVDYPDIAAKLCPYVTSKQAEFGILICGTGIGISISANKHKGIRAAVCTDEYCAAKTKQHNNANVLCLGGRVVGEDLAKSILDAYMSASFEGGRHQNRIDKIADIEKNQ